MKNWKSLLFKITLLVLIGIVILTGWTGPGWRAGDRVRMWGCVANMMRKTVQVRNEEGLHARPASVLVRLASKYESDFYIEMQGYRVNGKSILGVMTLAAETGAEMELITDGEDEAEAMEAIVQLFENRFGMDD